MDLLAITGQAELPPQDKRQWIIQRAILVSQIEAAKKHPCLYHFPVEAVALAIQKGQCPAVIFEHAKVSVQVSVLIRLWSGGGLKEGDRVHPSALPKHHLCHYCQLGRGPDDLTNFLQRPLTQSAIATNDGTFKIGSAVGPGGTPVFPKTPCA